MVGGGSYLLLDAGEERGVVAASAHQLGVGAVLRNLPVLHQHHRVTVRQVLQDQQRHARKKSQSKQE